MESIAEMMRTKPEKPFTGVDMLTECIRACMECAQACTSCADSCLCVENIKAMRHCIRLCLDCADTCACCCQILSRQQSPDLERVRRQVQLVALCCRACADECELHKDQAFCSACLEACRRCEDACKRVLAAMGTPAAHAPAH